MSRIQDGFSVFCNSDNSGGGWTATLKILKARLKEVDPNGDISTRYLRWQRETLNALKNIEQEEAKKPN